MGLTDARLEALYLLWRAVCRQLLRAPSPPCNLVPVGFLLTSMASFIGEMETLETLNKFVREVVQERRTAKIHAWKNWLREDLSFVHIYGCDPASCLLPLTWLF